MALQRQFSRSALVAFTRGMAPLVMENVTEATRAQLDATHAQVSAWRRDLSPQEWNQLHVVIIGPHMPRENLVVMQYFLRLLHEPREGRRVVYAESLWMEPQALDLLGTHLLDGSVGEAFFGDYMRMHRDLLGDAARQYLPRLLPKSANPSASIRSQRRPCTLLTAGHSSLVEINPGSHHVLQASTHSPNADEAPVFSRPPTSSDR